MEISIIIVNWNGRHLLKECLDSVFAQDFWDFEVILVDNGSEDGSVAFVEANYPQVRVIPLRSNAGFAEGNNVGIRLSGGKFVLTLNNDVTLRPGFLLRAHEMAFTDVCVAPRMLSHANPDIMDSAGICALADGAGRDLGIGEPAEKWNNMEEVYGPCAGAAMYPRRALEDVKEGDEYFDSSFFIGFEDVDLAHRLRLRGWNTVYCPAAEAIHLRNTTVATVPGIKMRYAHMNRLRTVIKCLPGPLLLGFLPWIALRQALEFGYCTIRHLTPIPLLARIDVLRELPALLAKRREIQRRKTADDGVLGLWFRPIPFRRILEEIE